MELLVSTSPGLSQILAFGLEPFRRFFCGGLNGDPHHFCDFRNANQLLNKRRAYESFKASRLVDGATTQWLRFEVLDFRLTNNAHELFSMRDEQNAGTVPAFFLNHIGGQL